MILTTNKFDQKFKGFFRSLKFSQTPDYTYLRNLFRSCLQMKGGTEHLRCLRLFS